MYVASLALVLWVTVSIASAAPPTLKCSVDPDWTVPAVKCGPFVIKKESTSSVVKVNPSRNNLKPLSIKPPRFAIASKPVEYEAPNSPISLEHMWDVSGGQDELNHIFEKKTRQDIVHQPGPSTQHRILPPRPQTAMKISSSSLRNHSGNNLGSWPSNHRNDVVAKSRLSESQPQAIESEYERKKSRVLKRLLENTESYDLLSQVQRARYDQANEISPPFKKIRSDREASSTDPTLKESSSTSIGHSRLRESWLFSKHDHPWNLKVSSIQADEIRSRFKHYTNSDKEIDDYLQRLSPDHLDVLLKNNPGSEAVNEIFKQVAPPTTWRNIDHERSRRRPAFKLPNSHDAESNPNQKKRAKGKAKMDEM